MRFLQNLGLPLRGAPALQQSGAQKSTAVKTGEAVSADSAQRPYPLLCVGPGRAARPQTMPLTDLEKLRPMDLELSVEQPTLPRSPMAGLKKPRPADLELRVEQPTIWICAHFQYSYIPLKYFIHTTLKISSMQHSTIFCFMRCRAIGGILVHVQNSDSLSTRCNNLSHRPCYFFRTIRVSLTCLATLKLCFWEISKHFNIFREKKIRYRHVHDKPVARKAAFSKLRSARFGLTSLFSIYGIRETHVIFVALQIP